MDNNLQLSSVSSRTLIRDLGEIVTVDLLPAFIKAREPYEILKQVQDDTIDAFQPLNAFSFTKNRQSIQ